MTMRRAVLPMTVFVGVMALHCAYVCQFPEAPPEQSRWVAIPRLSWLEYYISTQSHWLGISYALAFAFAAVALRRYREDRRCESRNVAVGGITVSAGLAAVGCFLVGCCGSPMLAVYAALFGTAFVPMMKPLLAGVTALCVACAWMSMTRESRRPCRSGEDACGCAPDTTQI